MQIILYRTHRTADSVDGKLMIANEKICDTAENTLTCLPEGTYNVLIHRCKHYRRKMPVILVDESLRVQKFKSSSHSDENIEPLNIEPLNCSACPSMAYCGNNTTLPKYCPMIKIGNGVHKRDDGSIIIGERITWGCMKHPVEHFNRLIDRLDKCQNRKEPITLTITEASPKRPMSHFNL